MTMSDNLFAKSVANPATDTLIRGGTVVNADRAFRADVLIAGDKIVAVGEHLSLERAHLTAHGAFPTQPSLFFVCFRTKLQASVDPRGGSIC